MRMGVPQAEVQAQLQAMRESQHQAGQPAEEELGVWAWHQDAVRLFRGMRGQWRSQVIGPRLVYLALDYGPLPGVHQALGLTPGPELHEQLQVMERAARDHMNRQHD